MTLPWRTTERMPMCARQDLFLNRETLSFVDGYAPNFSSTLLPGLNTTLLQAQSTSRRDPQAPTNPIVAHDRSARVRRWSRPCIDLRRRSPVAAPGFSQRFSDRNSAG